MTEFEIHFINFFLPKGGERAEWSIPCNGVGSFSGRSISVHAWLIRLSAMSKQNLGDCGKDLLFEWETDQWLSYKDQSCKFFPPTKQCD
jgi:hypothetical protein